MTSQEMRDAIDELEAGVSHVEDQMLHIFELMAGFTQCLNTFGRACFDESQKEIDRIQGKEKRHD